MSKLCRRSPVWVIGGIMIAAASGCGGGHRGDGAAALKTRSDMLVNTRWLAEALHRPDLVVVHVAGSAAGYSEGHIPGARFLAWNEVSATMSGILNELPPIDALTATVRRLGIGESDRIVLYDEETGLMAARAYVALDYLGLGDRTALLDGQLPRWKAEDRPLTTEEPPVAPSSYAPDVHSDVIVSLSAMKALVWTKHEVANARIAILDARPPDQYSGAAPGEGIRRPGHIPGAASLCWMNSIESQDDPRLRPVEQVAKLHREAGIKPDDLVITYCRTGVQSSYAYFVAKYLGYKARLYDGSFIEWSAASDTQVGQGLEP